MASLTATHIAPPSPTTSTSILLAAADHNIPALTSFLSKIPSVNTCLDPETNRSTLHAAIDSLPGNPSSEELCAAGETLQLLLNHGAIWNDLDNNNETPGCIAFRRGFTPLYDIVVAAGVRAEILLARIGGWETLSSHSSGDAVEEAGDDPEALRKDPEPVIAPEGAAEPIVDPLPPEGHRVSGLHPPEPDVVEPEAYLSSELTSTPSALLDADKNGVMMSWETAIMHRSADALKIAPGTRVLNVGFGMGIIDTYIQSLLAGEGSHHIIEAHPSVLRRMREEGWYDRANATVHEGRWQDVVPKLLEQGEEFDAIYFDTFAEDYAQLKTFFNEAVIAMLEPEKGRFGFFHGLGADRMVCWDVYTKVLELDLYEAGLDCSWEEVKVEAVNWKGVRRKYWDVGDVYRLPVCEFVK